MTAQSLLEVADLAVAFGRGPRVVDGVSFTLDRGETLALVGESGSGKSVTALSILQLLPYPTAHHPAGSIRLDGRELMGAPRRTLHHVRGERVGMIFQEPMAALNPLHNIEKQIGETLFLHKGMDRQQARRRIVELLHLVGLPEAEHRLGALPHELSGGQRQRVMIAMALAKEPDILIADEPTTALDVTIQAQILELLQDLQRRFRMAVLFITHDLGVVRRVADRVCVMQKGAVVERGPTEQVLSRPGHAYTKRLIDAEPGGEPVGTPPSGGAVMETEGLTVRFPVRAGLLGRVKQYVTAVDDVAVALRPGATLGVVGESGSGKSTLGLALLRLLPGQGPVHFEGHRLDRLRPRHLRPLRARMQIVFQDPYAALSPRLSVGQIVEEGLVVHGMAGRRRERRDRVGEALAEVDLDPAMQDRYPHEFSGGQRQRIAIARALALKPSVMVLDEPTSALDVSVQAQIVDLLRTIQARHQLAYLFISHDLRVVRALAHEMLVLKNGRAVEQGAAASIFQQPRADYTRALMAAAFELAADDTGTVRT